MRSETDKDRCRERKNEREKERERKKERKNSERERERETERKTERDRDAYFMQTFSICSIKTHPSPFCWCSQAGHTSGILSSNRLSNDSIETTYPKLRVLSRALHKRYH